MFIFTKNAIFVSFFDILHKLQCHDMVSLPVSASLICEQIFRRLFAVQGGVQHIRSSADFAYLVVFREYVDIVSFHVIGMFVDAVRAEKIVLQEFC